MVTRADGAVILERQPFLRNRQLLRVDSQWKGQVCEARQVISFYRPIPSLVRLRDVDGEIIAVVRLDFDFNPGSGTRCEAWMQERRGGHFTLFQGRKTDADFVFAR